MAKENNKINVKNPRVGKDMSIEIRAHVTHFVCLDTVYFAEN